MKKFSRLLVMLLLSIALAVFLTNCGSGGGGGGDSSSSSSDPGVSSMDCAWFGSASTRAPEGAYECSGNTIVKCIDGVWESVVNCGSTQNSKGYSCTCKGGVGADSTVCSYAFKNCGYSYSTCGDNADSIITDKWQCVEK